VYDLRRPLPVAAILKDGFETADGNIIPAGSRISVVQAELPDDGDALIGFKYEHKQGVCSIEEIEFID
jgi:hypothetical protein